MSLNVFICLIIVAFLIYLDLVLICVLIINKLKSDEKILLAIKNKKIFLSALFGNFQKTSKESVFWGMNDLKQSMQLDKQSIENVEKAIDKEKIEKKQIKRLKSHFKTSRIVAAIFLGNIATKKSKKALEKALLDEKDNSVKLYIANSLSDIACADSIPVLVSSLINSNRWYRTRVNMLICDFGESFYKYLPQIIKSDRIEIMELIVDYSSLYFADELKKYLIDIIENKEAIKDRIEIRFGALKHKCCAKCVYGTTIDTQGNRFCRHKGIVTPDFLCGKFKLLPVSVNSAQNFNSLMYRAADILAQYYPETFDDKKYLNSEDIEIKNTAIKALSCFATKENINQLIEYLKFENVAISAANSISKIVEKNPELINYVIEAFKNEKNVSIKQKLVKILLGRIEYIIMKLNTGKKNQAAEIIKNIIILGHSTEIIDFLNKNKDIDLENKIVEIIISARGEACLISDGFEIYLDERIANKCGIVHRKHLTNQKDESKDKKLVRTLYLLLVSLILLFPIIYVLRHNNILLLYNVIDQRKIFVVDFNYYLAFYSIAINTLYIGLLILSLYQLKIQYKRWKVKKTALLFKNRMLPSVSIIAPAFNEEKTIIESTNSLLSMKYPDYELVIVNDGSSDSTLEVLINYYDLIRVDHLVDNKLNTKPIRGIYKNRSRPKLIVVDKINGGKADSLNAGINISNKEYYCGIDADSLLEEESLLKLASIILDQGSETPALGGNVFPINGCRVERGQIKEIRIPKNNLAKFQTIEYIRAFMAGRLGWTTLNSLLIISGAFGLFRKERVITTGGYLTGSGIFAKDTVGEDMELVVRISRFMRELRQKFKICYVFNANCWTEVPEDFKSLKKQRYRWHRGLIDILTYHKKMLFNPRYGRTGMIAMPYFLIFEMIGPMIEIQGYLMVIVAVIFGLLNAEIALLLFISSILLGVLISISSLIIAEKDLKYFKLKDVLVLVIYAIIENFGPRQMFSLWRVGGYFSMLGKQKGWGKAERKGFADKDASASV